MHCHGPLFGQATENSQSCDFTVYQISLLRSVIGPTYMDYPFKLKPEWSEPLTPNAVVATVLGSILRHSGICGAADETVLNIAHKKERKKILSG